MVFQGTLGAEQDAVVGKRVKLTTTPYVFIVQERVFFGSSSVSEESTHQYNYDAILKVIDAPNQVLEGRFVTYGGEIANIYLSGATKLTINGKLLPGTTWARGDTEEPPSTWRVEGIAEGGLALTARMTNGQYFMESLVSYRRLLQSALPLSGGRLSGTGPASQYKSTSMRLWSTNRIYIEKRTSLTVGNLGSGTKWKIIQVGGHRPEDNYSQLGGKETDHGLPVWSFSESKSVTIPLYSDEAIFRHYWREDLALWSYSCNGWCIPSPIEANALAKFDLISSSQDFLPLNITAELQRQYTPAQLSDFQSKGIEPVFYTVVFQ